MLQSEKTCSLVLLLPLFTRVNPFGEIRSDRAMSPWPQLGREVVDIDVPQFHYALL